MQKLSFKPWHGTAYQRFNILIQKPDRKKRIGRILAPNNELALVKARELFPSREIIIEQRKGKDKKVNKQVLKKKKKS